MNRGILATIFAVFAFMSQSCSNKKESNSETVLKITNSEEFTSFVNDYNSGKFKINDSLTSPLSVVLENDIAILDENIIPIGSEEHPFIGSFDGKGHTITCCGIGQKDRMDNVGLIGYAKDSKINNVTVITDQVVGQNNVGVVCGCAYRTCISGCKASGHVNGDSYVGGVVGCASYGGISDCYFSGDIEASECLAGGIVGMLEFGGVVRSHAGGQATGKYAIKAISGNESEDVIVSECTDKMNIVIAGVNDNKTKKETASEKLNRLLFQM